MKFYKCPTCGRIVTVIDDSACPLVCCGKPMTELVANTTDGAKEKHVPVYEVKDGKVCVTVGSVAHPMLPEHFIGFVALRTRTGCQVKKLHPGEEPKACFALTEGDEVAAVYEYCNLHGLWKA
ncbi:MAG: desulfoferrodoxin FeS4 iron-binding domain-containing protein [Oscillospiraceae bacterium]|nr:desulfoferrodoxin FeS4 iron-binding domain-containing protein [Oscillospiraceae bacterium]